MTGVKFAGEACRRSACGARRWDAVSSALIWIIKNEWRAYAVLRRGASIVKVHTVEPNVDAGALLAGAQFIDAYSIAIDDAALDARRAAEKMLGREPRWIEALLRLRNRLVAPFGLKTPLPGETARPGAIGIFPILSETPDRLVAGLNDHHLDFRLVVDIAASGQGQRVTATTLVRTHNLLGRVYLAIILPFHRLIVRTLLRQIAA
jgi:Protein of unknown function (DUF2867)